MLCPTCLKRTTCQSVCELLEAELVKVEKPCTEILMTPNQLERLSDKRAEEEFYRNNDELDLEDAEPEELFGEEQIKSALEELTPKQREVLRLLHWEGLTQYQIAEKLGIGRTTVEGHIKAAHAIVRKYLISSLKTPVQAQLYI